MAGVALDNVGATVLPVFVFGLLQIASFWVLVIMVKRSCGMNALYHLAFVLKAQRPLIQGKLMIWMVVFPCRSFRYISILCWVDVESESKLTNYLVFVLTLGADFTFNFARLGYNF